MTKSVMEMAVGGKPKPGFPPTLGTGPQTGPVPTFPQRHAADTYNKEKTGRFNLQKN